MKKINKFYLTALSAFVTVALLIPVSMAQSANGQGAAQNQGGGQEEACNHHGRHGQGMAMIFSKLNLSDAQKAQMKQIRQSYRERTEPLRKELFSKMHGLWPSQPGGTFNEALATKTLTETAPLRAKLMGERFKEHKEMLAVLTPEQKAQLQQLREEYKAKREARRALQQSQVQ
jgi:Spy/CpxP family protein refolding chaperone